MKQISKKESGLAHIGIIIAAILVVAALAFASWWVWEKNQKEDINSSSQSSQSESQEEEKTNDHSEGGKYLVITEWGVKISLSDEVSEAYYKFRSEGNLQYVELYDKAFDALSNSKGIPCGGEHAYNFYVVSRATPEDAKLAEEEFVGSDYKQFSFTKQYLFSGLRAHQAPPYCASLNFDPNKPYDEDVNIIDIADAKERAFDAAFDSLQISE